MKLSIRITESERGGYIASCPSLPGCITRGQTREEAHENMKETIQGYLASVNDFVVPEKIAEQMVVLEV